MREQPAKEEGHPFDGVDIDTCTSPVSLPSLIAQVTPECRVDGGHVKRIGEGKREYILYKTEDQGFPDRTYKTAHGDSTGSSVDGRGVWLTSSLPSPSRVTKWLAGYLRSGGRDWAVSTWGRERMQEANRRNGVYAAAAVRAQGVCGNPEK